MSDLHDPEQSRLGQSYRAMLKRRRADRRDCVTPDELLGVVEGTLAEPERLRVLRHVGSCDRCHKELELLRLSADVAHQVSRPRWMRTPLLAAAATVILAIGGVALLSRGGTPTVDIERTSPGGVQLVQPPEDGVTARPVTLVWSPVPAARRYEVELLDAQGGPVFVTSTRDTVVTIPDSTALGAGDYRWWVRAVNPDGSQRASTMRRLRVTTP